MQRSTPWLILVIVVLAILVILSKRSSVEGQDAAVQAPAGPEAAVAIVGGATLNHFKCYGTKGSEVGKTVLLRDQFAAEKVRVLGPEQFCNPVAKRHGRFIWPIVDRDAHLKLYRIRSRAASSARWRVTVNNQFGNGQRLEVGKPRLLAVPSRKVEPGGHQAPKGLSHFKCYEARGKNPAAKVGLRDQFLPESGVGVGPPRLFCNPAEKRSKAEISPIAKPERHLVCYALAGREAQHDVLAVDQFGREKNRLGRAGLLCVPSKKVEVTLGFEPFGPEAVQSRLARLAMLADGKEKALPPKWTGCRSTTPDYVVSGSESTAAGDDHCFPSLGGGAFGARSNIPGLATVDGMDVADLDGDGDNDFLACDGVSGYVYQYVQGPPSVFTPNVVANGITTGAHGSLFCTNLRVADFDDDGDIDFVVGDNRVTNGTYVYLQGPVGSFSRVAPGLDVSWASPTGRPCNCLFGLAAGDVDGDGHADIIMLGYRGEGAGQVHLYRGDGTGAMGPPSLLFDVGADFPVVATPTGIALIDQERDGDLDIVVGGSADGSHYLYENNGGAFAPPAAYAFNVKSFSGIDGFDFDADDDADLVVVDWWNRRLLSVENLGGTPAFGAPLAGGTLAGPSIAVGAPELPDGDEAGALDHFACYAAGRNQPVERPVMLHDQFGDTRAVAMDVAHFCNPARKVHRDKPTEISNPDAHLAFYRLKIEGQRRERRVTVSNQFGAGQRILVEDAVFLAVPTQKLRPQPHGRPAGLDHFLCYQAKGASMNLQLGLADQFIRQGVRVYETYVLCNPTEKRTEQAKVGIRNVDDHLMCYRMRGDAYEGKVQIRNQFGDGGFPVRNPNVLCVPSKKSPPPVK